MMKTKQRMIPEVFCRATCRGGCLAGSLCTLQQRPSEMILRRLCRPKLRVLVFDLLGFWRRFGRALWAHDLPRNHFRFFQSSSQFMSIYIPLLTFCIAVICNRRLSLIVYTNLHCISNSAAYGNLFHSVFKWCISFSSFRVCMHFSDARIALDWNSPSHLTH
ncbi:hypothetical protein BDV28DRAFT_23271 [Aspergillus coremiiformis]|uniref:Uncharacterized protein n=1 Tax=Aspergillus coremiiformis TaxID=138285 RepID=A0A5N6Z0N9_9EURO|nr:hypothetical protein BDV28DRAFT_23271 [Aspergillus coremiiformis]